MQYSNELGVLLAVVAVLYLLVKISFNRNVRPGDEVNKSPTPEDAFWSWFLSNEDAFYQSTDANPFLVLPSGEIRAASLNSDLRVKLGDIDEFGVRNLFVSCMGVRESISAVDGLVDAAPSLARWRVVKFMPRLPHGIQSARLGDVMLSSEEVKFVLEPGDERVHVQLYVEDIPTFDGSRWMQIAGFWVLQSLGEEVYLKRVGDLSVFVMDLEQAGVRNMFRKLPSMSSFPASFDATCEEAFNR